MIQKHSIVKQIARDIEDGTLNTDLKLECHAQVSQQQTGCEMEAMVGVSMAALTIYDMCKGIDKGIVIKDLQLKSKSGGKTGDYTSGKT